jgi:hypothetical protein
MSTTQTLKAAVLALASLFAISLAFNVQKYLEDDSSICVDYSNQSRSNLQFGAIRDITKNYRDGQLENIKSMTSLNDTKAIHFSLDSIDKFIYNIKRDVLQNSQNPNQLELGLRIYFAAYPDLNRTTHSDLNDVPKNFSNRMTVVFLPTIRNSDGKIVDFDPTDSDTYNDGLPRLYESNEDGIFVPTTTTLDPTKQIPSLLIKETSARNHGQLYPPFSVSEMSF